MSARSFPTTPFAARFLILLPLILAVVLCPGRAHAQIPQLTTVHRFTGQDGEGSNPSTGVT